MAATGYTPISLYYSTTASAVPVNTNLANGELALNIQDEKLYFKNAAGTVKLLASNSSTVGVDSLSFGSTGLTPSTATTGAITVAGTLNVANGGTGKTSYTANGVLYASGTGTLASGSALTFDGTNILQINGSSAGYLKGPSGEMLIGQDASAVYVGTGAGIATAIPIYYGSPGTTFQRWQTGGSERMRLDSSGNLGVGTTAPNSILQVSKASANPTIIATRTGNSATTIGDALYLRLNDSYGVSGMRTEIGMGYGVPGTQTYTPAVIGYVQTNGSSNTYGDLYFATRSVGTDTAPTERARISAAGGFSVGTTADPGAGAIYATGNITAYYSDARLKTVSGKIENALDKVATLSGVYYTNNDTAKSFGYDSDEVQVGVLAQEVEAVMPEIVKPAPFDLDQDGNSKSGENYKTVQYERLVPLLIEAINELRAEVKALKGA